MDPYHGEVVDLTAFATPRWLVYATKGPEALWLVGIYRNLGEATVAASIYNTRRDEGDPLVYRVHHSPTGALLKTPCPLP
jgi:hypothetical protein